MAGERPVVATFAAPADAARAIGALRAAGFRVEAAMPAPFPEVVAALGRPRSRLGLVTFPGAIAGLVAGTALTVGTSVAWPLVTGGKPIVSIPPFVIVIFELTVLVGALVNLAAVAVGSLGGARREAAVSRPRAVEDRVAVLAAGADREAARRILREAGAEEVADA
ncbi:quinol:electron acceptor oxidoreductase subunit ActD [Anaeromyxobacter oryzisoli]|uniref:quinol:electron acceptor oxidoreductase subunit ActD n=1 Tax=Anaeromyxobacter oryzisoli TaxID=2925408 RepID=UPI001F5A4364|nr:quinol:electron acceptor oxidoreductase subunit ActD [Anaeromyxobacter sp. SG63]